MSEGHITTSNVVLFLFFSVVAALLSLLKVPGDVVVLNLLISAQKLGELGVSKNFVFHSETFHSVINR